MDDPALKLLQARRVIQAERDMRSRAEQTVRKLTLENNRLRRAVVGLQRQAAKAREEHDGGTVARSEVAPGPSGR